MVDLSHKAPSDGHASTAWTRRRLLHERDRGVAVPGADACCDAGRAHRARAVPGHVARRPEHRHRRRCAPRLSAFFTQRTLKRASCPGVLLRMAVQQKAMQQEHRCNATGPAITDYLIIAACMNTNLNRNLCRLQ